MIDVTYTKIDPSGNITVLVESPVEAWLRPWAAEQICLAEPDTEQVGFVSAPEGSCDFRLDMAGGEFCGNACLSAAALWLERSGYLSARLALSVSGAERPVTVEVSHRRLGGFAGIVDMPLPLSVERVELPFGDGTLRLPVVRFPGISHVIASPKKLSPADAEEHIRSWCAFLGAKAIGVMLFDRPELDLKPLVWVPKADTLCWERSCASGTAAVGAYEAYREHLDRFIALSQPGGRLGVTVEMRSGALSRLALSGQAKILHTKTLAIV